MNYEEMIAMLGECVENTDKMPGNIDKLADALKEQKQAFEAMQTHIEELEKTNNELRNDNYKMVMSRLHNEGNLNAQDEEVTRTQRVEEYAKRFRESF